MVRLIKNGRRIQLLPLPSKDGEEDVTCPDCKEKFNGEGKRRCCYAQCGHVTCLDCVRESKTGCDHCSVEEERVPSSSSNVTTNLVGCPTLTTSGPMGGENGNKDDYDGEPPILEKEEEIDVENGGSDEDDDQFRIVLRKRGKASQNSKEKQQLQKLSLFSSSRMGRWPCKHCNYLCTSKATLDEHLTKEHSKGPVALATKEQSRGPVTVPTQKRPEIHPKTQTKERPFQCYLCGQSFNRMFHVVRHMEAIHQDQVHLLPPVSSKTSGDGAGARCPVCKSKFQSHRTMKYSLLRRAKTDSCDHICCLMCIAKMAGGCSLCSAAGGSSFNVKRLPHKGQKITTFPGQRKNRQVMARKRNRNISLATKAMIENNVDRISKGEGTPKGTPPKSWDCQRCGFTYCRPYSLQRHVERAHKDIVTVSPGSPNETNGLSQCPKCKVQFEMLKHSRFRRASYVQCDHSICLWCLINEDLTCSQCANGSAGETQPVSRKIQSNGLVKTVVDKKQVVQGEVKTPENVRIEQEGRFRCLICDFSFSRHLSFERHLGRMHGVELVKSDEQDEQPKKGKQVDDLYCPECQEEYGPSDENQKAKYTSCGHTSCLKCILKAELGCGKCTTENDPRWIYVTALGSPSPKRKMPVASILSNDESQSQSSPESLKRSASANANARPLKNFKSGQIGQSNGMNSFSALQSSPSRMSLRLRPSNDIQQLTPKKIQQNGSTMSAQGRPQSLLKKATAFGMQNRKEYEKRKPIYGQAGKNFSVGMKVIRCNHCGKSFMGKLARNLHIQKFHSSDRHHVCNYCQWKSQSPRDLERHILQHTKEKPFKCHLCTAAFTRKFTLTKHMKRTHQKKNQRH